MSSRKQADQVRPHDHIGLNVQLYFEVQRREVRSDHIELQVTPAQCLQPGCPTTCGCHYSLFDGQGGPFTLRVDAKTRLKFSGNLQADEAELKRLEERVQRLRAAGKSTADPDTSSGPHTPSDPH